MVVVERKLKLRILIGMLLIRLWGLLLQGELVTPHRLFDSRVLHRLALESAEQRKLNSALVYAKQALKVGAESDLEVWLLLARVLSAQKRFSDAETIVDATLNETGKWEQGKLLRLKAKLRLARGEVKDAIKIYTELLALLQVQSKSFSSSKKKLPKGCVEELRSLELGTWHDLAHIYIDLSQWHDAETCLSRSRLIAPYSPVRYHTEGVLYKRQGQLEEAMEAFTTALHIDPMHVPRGSFGAWEPIKHSSCEKLSDGGS